MPRRPAAVTLPPALVALAALQQEVLTTAQLVEHGLGPSARVSLIRNGTLVVIGRGLLALCPPRNDLSARVAAAVLGTGVPGVGCLLTAAALDGWRDPLPTESVHLWLPGEETRHQRRPGVRLHWSHLADHEIVGQHPVRWTSRARTARDLLVHLHRNESVAILDAALHRGRLDAHTLTQVAELLPRGRRPYLDLIDARSESWLETQVRLLLHDAGLHPALQHELRDRGRIVARFDLAFPHVRIAIECDGRAVHEAAPALLRDRHRDDDVRQLGWRIIRVTWSDVHQRPDDVLRRLRRAMALAS